jgi:hypothetical protein
MHSDEMAELRNTTMDFSPALVKCDQDGDVIVLPRFSAR